MSIGAVHAGSQDEARHASSAATAIPHIGAREAPKRLKGFPEAIAAVFPPTIVQICIVHLIRDFMDFASWKDRKPIAA